MKEKREIRPELVRFKEFAVTFYDGIPGLAKVMKRDKANLYSYFTKNSAPGNKLLPELEKVGCNRVWLSTGQGSMIADNEAGAALMEKFHLIIELQNERRKQDELKGNQLAIRQPFSRDLIQQPESMMNEEIFSIFVEELTQINIELIEIREYLKNENLLDRELEWMKKKENQFLSKRRKFAQKIHERSENQEDIREWEIQNQCNHLPDYNNFGQ